MDWFLYDNGLRHERVNNDQINLSEKDLSEIDLYNAMNNMQNNKSPGNDIVHELEPQKMGIWFQRVNKT